MGLTEEAEADQRAGCTSPRAWATSEPTTWLRGMANLLGPGWNRPQDAVYPLSQKDADGNEYNGAEHSYVMRFEKGQLPPAEAFWSLTMYDPEFFFVPNPINRYDLSQRNKLIANPGRIGGPLSPGGITGPGQGSQLAACARKGNSSSCCGCTRPGKRRPRSWTAPGQPPPVRRKCHRKLRRAGPSPRSQCNDTRLLTRND